MDIYNKYSVSMYLNNVSRPVSKLLGCSLENLLSLSKVVSSELDPLRHGCSKSLISLPVLVQRGYPFVKGFSRGCIMKIRSHFWCLTAHRGCIGFESQRYESAKIRPS